MAPLEIAWLALAAVAAFIAGALVAMRWGAASLKRQLLEERVKLETLVQNIPDGLVIANLRGEVMYLNGSAIDILGVRPDEARALNKGLFELLDHDLLRMTIQRILVNHLHAEVIDIPIPGKEGASRHFRTTVTMFSLPEGGEDFGVAITLRDVSAEKRVDAAKEEFFQSVAHDLRAPLFAVKGYLKLIERSLKPAGVEQKGYIDAISESCEKLTLLIQDTLDSARLEAGQLKLKLTRFDAAQVARRVADLLAPVAAEKGVTLAVGPVAEVPGGLEADERLLERVMINLVSNALKFTPAGGRVEVRMNLASAEQAEFTVTDTGPGVPEESRRRIFDKYNSGPSESKQSGFGLGLHICRRILEMHGGSIWSEPGPEKGSQFTFRMPTRQNKTQN